MASAQNLDGYAWEPFGAITTAAALSLPKSGKASKYIRVHNADPAAAHYITFGDTTVGVPTSGANGIPIPPGSIVILAIPKYAGTPRVAVTHVRGDAGVAALVTFCVASELA